MLSLLQSDTDEILQRLLGQAQSSARPWITTGVLVSLAHLLTA
jgi:hypothetical protein